MSAIIVLCALTMLLLAPSVLEADSSSSQNYSCKIKGMADDKIITLWEKHSSGVNDAAFASYNIIDFCNMEMAARSEYTCNECPDPGAPGGYTNLSYYVMEYIEVANSLTDDLQVIEIAGGCHSCNSKHYEGKAMEILKQSDEQANHLVDLCTILGGKGMKTSNHIHCQFP